MAINFTAPVTTEMKPRIIVIGVGGAGGNAVNNMIRSGLDGVEFLVANTDAQSLLQSEAERKIQLGVAITQGLGSGAQPEVGRSAAEETLEQIEDHLENTHMAFITAGMGGGTGTGAAPVIAKACQERNILTVGVVTKPFKFEGSHRMATAEKGIEELQRHVDTLLIIPNQNLFRVATEKTTFADAFSMADRVLHSGVRGITDLMVAPGLINLDFADVRTVMREMGKAMMGTGEADGEDRANRAAEDAINNPLLEDASMNGARGVLINITGGPDLTLFEVEEAAERIRKEVAPDANIIVGSALEEELNGRIRVSIVATGIDTIAAAEPIAPPKPALVPAVAVDDRAQAEDVALMQREEEHSDEVATPYEAEPASEPVTAETQHRVEADATVLTSEETDALEAAYADEVQEQQAYAQHASVDGANALAMSPTSYGGTVGETANTQHVEPDYGQVSARSSERNTTPEIHSTGADYTTPRRRWDTETAETEAYVVEEAEHASAEAPPPSAEAWAQHAMPDARDPEPMIQPAPEAEKPKRGLFSRVSLWRHRTAAGSRTPAQEQERALTAETPVPAPRAETSMRYDRYSSDTGPTHSHDPYTSAPAQARLSQSSAAPVESHGRHDSVVEDVENTQEGEDLAIPSFLRRQAN